MVGARVLVLLAISGCIHQQDPREQLCATVKCGTWQRHDLTQRARAVKISKLDPPSCELVGTFFTYKDCLDGYGTGDTNEEAQLECMKWKSDQVGGNYAVIDGLVGDGYYKGRVLKCP